MEDEQQKIKDNFSKNLKATDYMVHINDYWKDSPEFFRFNIKFIHDVFSSAVLWCATKLLRAFAIPPSKGGNSNMDWFTAGHSVCERALDYENSKTDKFQGTKLLEIGSGVTVHSIASASQYFPNIVMSDYVEDNVEELRKWLKGQSSIKQMLDVQAELEGYGNDLATGRKLIESRIRKNVKRVTRCDVLKDGILLEKDTNPETSPPYDVVISCLCLEDCPVDVKGYGDNMKRINTLLKPGGGLLLVGFFQGSTWKAGGHTFHHLSIDQPVLLDALTNAGFGDIEIKTVPKEGAQYKNFACSEMFCLVAKKMNYVN